MNDMELWKLFCQKNKIESNNYETWAFGGNPDAQLQLVLDGKKTMTESLYDLYEIEDEKLPEIGNYSVILNTNGDAKCIIRTINVRIVPFDEITIDDARRSGEGDQSLEYWKQVHHEYFYQELKRNNVRFDDSMKIVLEDFEVVFVA